MDSKKFPPYRIHELTNADDDFYPLLGPMLSRREIVAEIGAPVWDDDRKTWHVAVAGTDEVLGMIAVKGKTICSFYVTPDNRGQSVGYALLCRAMKGLSGEIKATATDSSVELFTTVGFKETGRRGRYHTMCKADS